MALTDVELCNVALGFLGHKRPISTLSDRTAEAQQCAIYYPHAKGLVSVAHWWPFLERNALLAEHATATDVRWAHVYIAPADMAAPRFIWAGARIMTRDSVIPFALADIGSGTSAAPGILSDQADARLFYTVKNLPIAAYSDPVKDAIAWRLAAFLAGPLAVKPALALQVVRESRMALAIAAAFELNKGQKDVPADPEYLRVR